MTTKEKEQAKVGRRLNYGKHRKAAWATLWEVTAIQERGMELTLVYPGSKGYHGHKHLLEWNDPQEIDWVT